MFSYRLLTGTWGWKGQRYEPQGISNDSCQPHQKNPQKGTLHKMTVTRKHQNGPSTPPPKKVVEKPKITTVPSKKSPALLSTGSDTAFHSSLFSVNTSPPKYFDGRGELWGDWLEKFTENGWQRHQLPAGDFWFQSIHKTVVGIEVKSVSDFVGRLDDARSEFSRMCKEVEVPIFMVFGPWQRCASDDTLLLSSSRKVRYSDVKNLLLTFQVNRGLIYEPVLSREHALLRINQLYAYFQNPSHKADVVKRKASTDQRVAMLML